MSLKKHELFINGQWVKPESGAYVTITNPANGVDVAAAAKGSVQDVDRAVAAARKAFGPWSAKTASARADYLYALERAVVREREKLAITITSEMGKPITEARMEVDFAAGLLRFAAENTRRLQGEIIPAELEGEKILIDRVPHGVVGAIAAWNFPLALCARKIGPALAAGNTIVVKPHELSPLSALALAALAQEVGLPEGVLNIVTGDGPDVGVPLVAHADVPLITMTGSTLRVKNHGRRCRTSEGGAA